MNAPIAASMPLNIHIPTISSSAMLVELSLSSWTGRKLDRKASDEVTSNKNADRGVARVNKDLLGHCNELAAIHKYDAGLRQLHYRYTLPWSDSNPARLLAVKYFQAYGNDINHALQERQALVDTFLAAYDWEIAQAKVKLGDLFDENEYPSVHNVRTRFSHNVSFLPMPDGGNWLLDMDAHNTEMLRSQCESLVKDRVATAMNDVWTRLHGALSKMSERLDFADGEKKIFRDTLVDNVMDVVDVLKVCNLTNDPRLDDARQRLEVVMRGVSAEGLREDHGLRRKTKEEVDAIIKGLPSLGW